LGGGWRNTIFPWGCLHQKDAMKIKIIPLGGKSFLHGTFYWGVWKAESRVRTPPGGVEEGSSGASIKGQTKIQGEKGKQGTG